MKKFDIPKPKPRSYKDEIEDQRLQALDHFESKQLSVFVKAIADELQMDESAAFSLIHFASQYGFADWFRTEKEKGHIKWVIQWYIFRSGWTPIEFAHWLSRNYQYLFTQTLDDLKWNRPKRYEALSSGNAINFLARTLFYNDPANRFET